MSNRNKQLSPPRAVIRRLNLSILPSRLARHTSTFLTAPLPEQRALPLYAPVTRAMRRTWIETTTAWGANDDAVSILG
jgi:hypothetical protein